MTHSTQVRASVTGGIGRLTLDRARALNALDIGMIRAIRHSLDTWAVDSSVRAVVLDGAGDRGFCSGGDVRVLREHILAGNLASVASFFQEEYEVNALIAEYPKSVIAIADGVTMGGGIGLAGHAQVRVVTERSALAMPETAIGFTPDVGGSLLLARAPGHLGEYLALTGRSVNAVDAVSIGLADHIVDSTALTPLLLELESGIGIGEALGGALAPSTLPKDDLDEARGWIDLAFSAASVPEIYERLLASPEPEAGETAQILARLSPTSLAVTLESVRRARDIDNLREVLQQEYRLAMWFATTQDDLPEGIRAMLVDRDRAPRWNPPALASLPAEILSDAFEFAPGFPAPRLH